MALVSYNATLNEWENLIRVKLKVANPALIKSGALGILTGYLAGIKYDALEFYSKTMQEMNVGLAQDFNSMLYHSTIFGTELEFAVPSTLSSSIIIPEIQLTSITELVYSIPRYTTFSDSNGIDYLYESEIKVTITSNNIKATSWDPQQGTKNLTVSKAPNPNLPNTNVLLIHNSNVKQYIREFNSYVVPTYSIGDSFKFSLGVDSILNVKDVYVWVNTGTHLNTQQLQSLGKLDPDQIEGSYTDIGASIQKVNIRFYKFDSSIRDLDIFLEMYETSLSFETGDGTHGTIMPSGAQLITELDTTRGQNGNIPNSEYILPGVNVDEKYINGGIDRSYTTTLNGLSTTGSSGGKDIEQVDGIRNNIFNQITVRQSVITENDYERLFKYQDIKPFVDAKFIDAKAFVFIFNVIHDNDQIVYSTGVNYKESVLANNPFYPLYDYNGVSMISPFYYKNNSDNTTDAYIVDPGVTFTLLPTSSSPNIGASTDYRVNLKLTYEFQRTSSGMNGKSYIEIQGDVDPTLEYYFYASWLGAGAYIPLNESNNYKYEINSMYTDPYCIVRENTENVKLQVYDIGSTEATLLNRQLVAEFEDPGVYHQLILKQVFYKYFTESELPLDVVQTSRNTIGYLDNYLSGVMSTIGDLATPDESFIETYLLRLPFIDENWFFEKTPQDVFEVLDDYFIAKDIDANLNYNTQLTQSFHNTIDIPVEYQPYIFEENTNIIDKPEFNFSIEAFVNQDELFVSKYQQITDLEIAIRIAAIEFMKEKEGFMIDFYETELEKFIWNKFSPLLNNIKVQSPTTFKVNNSATIYNLIQENLTFKEVLDFIPPFFYYDYENLVVTLRV